MNFEQFLKDLTKFVNEHPYFDAYTENKPFNKEDGAKKGDMYILSIDTPDEEYNRVKIGVMGFF